MSIFDNKRIQEYQRWGVEPPSHDPHGIDTDELLRKLKEHTARASSWHMEGNILVAYTDIGEVRQTIPTDYICLGMDKKGLPILKKIGI